MASSFLAEHSPKRGDAPDMPRARKRAKYTQLACNECKRRKLKCSGGTVCSRCVRDKVQCEYTPNSHITTITSTRGVDFKSDGLSAQFKAVDHRIESLQREMYALSARMREMESSASSTSGAVSIPQHTSAAAALHRIMNPPKSPPYVGPTSAEFGLASPRKHSDDSNVVESNESTAPSPSASTTLATGDPLRSLGQVEALRLVQVYENTVGLMYPCVDLNSVRKYVADFYQTGYPDSPPPSDQDWFFARDIEVLKIILAIALLAESHGRSERAAQLADSVEDQFASRLKIAEVDMKEILILTLVSIFHSYRDDEVIAWRLTGIAVRGLMELGLHRQDTWLKAGGVFPGELQWTWASRLFWCIYVMDRKWSFGTGLPFAIQDSDMDTNLPGPDATTPYFSCMISYARLSGKIWSLVTGWGSRPRAATADHCAYLDFQVQQWAQSIPQELRFDPSSQSGQDGNLMMLQVLLALQANQLRILVYRQNLLGSESIETDISGASIAVETAKNTVHTLDLFSQVSDIYFQRPEPFNYFLISALAALFLAVLHAPARFSQVCRPEFYTAVDLVRRSSTGSCTSRRLQKIIRSLKSIKLNIGSGRTTRSGNDHKQRSGPSSSHSSQNIPSQAVAPAPLDAPGIPTPQLSGPMWSMSPATVPETDHNDCEDLTSFFEMAGGLYFDPGINANSRVWEENGQGSAGFDAFQADEALTRVMAGLL